MPSVCPAAASKVIRITVAVRFRVRVTARVRVREMSKCTSRCHVGRLDIGGSGGKTGGSFPVLNPAPPSGSEGNGQGGGEDVAWRQRGVGVRPRHEHSATFIASCILQPGCT